MTKKRLLRALETGEQQVARSQATADTLLMRPELPFTVRVPMNRLLPNDGERLNVGTQYVDVQVILDPTMEKRGECRYGAYGGPVIALREWDEQVYLHELLHAATGYCQPRIEDTHPPEGHDVLSRIEVALWETGWRRSTATADTGLRERVEPPGGFGSGQVEPHKAVNAPLPATPAPAEDRADNEDTAREPVDGHYCPACGCRVAAAARDRGAQ